ncbi:hypothetical protein G7Y89_g13283 [Cudoniella acicularis]|uniref:N-acetylglucosamine-induced protein 1 n=1 Tax=Cudoniella acicularis TaxID=354080 RepID=A0A8H4VW76_9HELO|nr:hypothetical protein G7Y89_g13283 [Cudoniella acicularis]
MQFTVSSILALAASATAATIQVAVGQNGLTYTPNNITASVGDLIQFSFFPKNHSVTQSSFADPCHPLAGGFFSTFQKTTLSQKDLAIISTPDSQYTPLTWPTVQHIIRTNRLDAFQRQPSELRRYLAYNHTLKKLHGSIMAFILKERLGWEEPLVAKGNGEGKGVFEEESDWKVLWNDWPYGIDPRVVHLVVWTKFELEEDAGTGDLTNRARGEIEELVSRVFRERCGGENVIWFKNWKSLKSVHAVEHFHVMLYDPDPSFIKEITHGDIPLSQKV